MSYSIQDSPTSLYAVSPGSSSRCSTPSSVTSSSSSTTGNGDESTRGDSASLSNSSFSLDGGVRKKRQKRTGRGRTSFYAYQLTGLTQVFEQEQYLDPAQRRKIADALDLELDTITRWFQNRRAKYRRERNNTVHVKEEGYGYSMSAKEGRQETTVTPPLASSTLTDRQVSLFTMDSILQSSPRVHFSSECTPKSTKRNADPPAPSFNSYYEYKPYYYPPYMHHYYPVVPAHSRAMYSSKTGGQNSGPPEQPLDLSCGEKKRSCDENGEPAFKRRKIVDDCKLLNSNFTRAEITPAIKHGSSRRMLNRDSVYYSKFASMNNPSPYYSSFAYDYGKCQDVMRYDWATDGFGLMMSAPLHSSGHIPYGY
ncbi:uncharacterized protein LOC102801800 [Saccoglossus kowalevskii]|uniref:Paired box protein Pax-6-like n=1 Tax=Saccoglossus kowalevskii TaxID=10224 RepID=A0ABM0MQZ1_SACKO|nr:PREDICTED: paired box protein Pax-6-like [Saccoglossus kowalevskii]